MGGRQVAKCYNTPLQKDASLLIDIYISSHTLSHYDASYTVSHTFYSRYFYRVLRKRSHIVYMTLINIDLVLKSMHHPYDLL